jgi:AAA domain
MSSNGVPLEFDGASITRTGIRSFADIPDITTLEIPPVEYLVPALGIARNTITLWTGPDGDGKTFLAQVMALAVAKGVQFLGMTCQQSPVLYVDLENPGYVVKDRLQSLIEDGKTPAGFRFWGTWLPIDQQPPQVNSELLLTICKDSKPLLIVDPFRYFHSAEENDSTAMSGVMQYLRACAVYGAAVVILHHPAKTEGSTGRGSSAIRGACDLAFLHKLDRESGLITITVDKNRLGPSRTITVRADFEEGRFELAEAPYITRRNDELDRLERIIETNPGITQNAICKQLGARKNRIVKLLQEGTGTRWITEKGKYGAILYHLTAKPLYPKDGTADTASFEEGCIAVSTPLRVEQDTARREGKGLPSCQKCGSYALYEGMCQTCQTTRPAI